MIVLFYCGNTPLSRLIRWVTRSEYSHVAIMVNGVLYEAVGRGIRRLTRRQAWRRAREAAAFALVRASKDDEQQARDWLDARVEQGYSILGFLAAGVAALTGYRIRFVVALAGEQICSSLVAGALQCAGLLPDAEPRLETPASLARRLCPQPLYTRQDGRS